MYIHVNLTYILTCSWNSSLLFFSSFCFFVIKQQIARPQKAPFDATSTDPAKNYEDSNTLYASVSDGTCYPKERWSDIQFPKIKKAVQRVMSGGVEMIDGEKLLASPQYVPFFFFSFSPLSYFQFF